MKSVLQIQSVWHVPYVRAETMPNKCFLFLLYYVVPTGQSLARIYVERNERGVTT